METQRKRSSIFPQNREMKIFLCHFLNREKNIEQLVWKSNSDCPGRHTLNNMRKQIFEWGMMTFLTPPPPPDLVEIIKKITFNLIKNYRYQRLHETTANRFCNSTFITINIQVKLNWPPKVPVRSFRPF